MGMIGNYYMTEEETITKLQVEKLSIESLIYAEGNEEKSA